MALVADKAQDLFERVIAISPLIALVLTPLGFGVAVFLARTVFPNSQGSGIPQVIAARKIEDPVARNALVSLRVAMGKIVVMMLGLLCGASIGREGPTVQVGASIMGFIGRKAPIVYQQNLLLAGAAAGIAAAFNTPLAGIVFGIEELSRSFEAKASGLVIGCIIAAGVTSLAILGDYTYFGTTNDTIALGRGWLIVPALRHRRRGSGRPIQPDACHLPGGRSDAGHPSYHCHPPHRLRGPLRGLASPSAA